MTTTRIETIRVFVYVDTDGVEQLGLSVVQGAGVPTSVPKSFVCWVGDAYEITLNNGIPGGSPSDLKH